MRRHPVRDAGAGHLQDSPGSVHVERKVDQVFHGAHLLEGLPMIIHVLHAILRVVEIRARPEFRLTFPGGALQMRVLPVVHLQHHVVFGLAKSDISRFEFEPQDIPPGVHGSTCQALKAGNPVFGEKAPDVLAVAAMLGHEPRDLKEIDVFRIVGPVKLGRPRRPSCQQTGVVDRRVNHAEVMPAAAPYACIRSIKSGNSRRMNAMFFRK